MGNDMSVFEEGELEKDFWKAYGPKNESWTEFFTRSFAGMTKILMQPKRMDYVEADVGSHSEDTDFRHESFTIPTTPAYEARESDVAQLAAVLWRQGHHRPGAVPRPLVVYLHTNTRCLLDAKEVLPLCDALGASLLAFDLPGCGHSEGNLTFQMTRDLHRVLLHAHLELGFREIVLWARGMATAIAVEYCASWPQQSSCGEDEASPGFCVKFVVLDSPYTSVKQMVVDGSKAIKCFGLSVPETMVRVACRVVRSKVASRLGSDPFDLKPLRLVEAAAQQEQGGPCKLPPCHIFSALNDDYIPVTHGRDMQVAWEVAGAPCCLREFSGRHFGERDSELLLEAREGVRSSLEYDKEAAEAQALSSLSLGGPGLGGVRVPWAGVW